MTIDTSKAYEFAFRGLLAESALDQAGRRRRLGIHEEAELLGHLPFDMLDEERLTAARLMSAVYATIAAFENSVRDFITTVMADGEGPDWWDQKVSSNIRSRAEKRRKQEAETKWHATRGEGLLHYTDMGDLSNIVQQNWALFEPHVLSVDWVKSILDVVERSRNVIMHSGSLEEEDVARLGINMRDWLTQVGT